MDNPTQVKVLGYDGFGIRKRFRPSSPCSPTDCTKVPRLDPHFHNGSSYVPLHKCGDPSKPQPIDVRTRVKRRLSSIKSILSRSRRSFGIGHEASGNCQALLPADGSESSLGYSQSQESTTTTLVHTADPGRLILTAITVNDSDSPSRSISKSSNSSHLSGFLRSASTHTLSRRVSQKLVRPWNDPTVVHKPQFRNRPSVCEFNEIARASTTWAPNPMFLPTVNGHSKMLLNYRNTSQREEFSEMMAQSPRSLLRHEIVNENDTNQGLTSTGHNIQEGPRLSPILECPALQPKVTIETVESTTNAKVFLETHFNSLFYGCQPRSLRKRELEEKLYCLKAPYATRCHARNVWKQHETNRLRLGRALRSSRLNSQNKRILISRYDVIKVLGKGSFGVVRLVRDTSPITESSSLHRTPLTKSESNDTLFDKSTSRLKLSSQETCLPVENSGKGRVFAMKVIRKSEMLRNCQEGHLRAERDFLVAAEGSQWIIPLIAALQDDSYLYLVMEYCIGGDFLSFLMRENILPEDTTKWYVAEMILCVEEAHRMKWIHRDVKPDNFLIGANGHLKISDFGLAFDGQWEHDQKYYHKERHNLLQKLGLDLVGDEQDQENLQCQEASQRFAYVTATPRRTGPAVGPASVDEPYVGEPILDWRNRVQRRRLARSVVGTSQYMAPEVIREERYDGRCD